MTFEEYAKLRELLFDMIVNMLILGDKEIEEFHKMNAELLKYEKENYTRGS
ncbi:hypothetical protein KAT92_05355 [Candidatus Babeliales bacterium]|nr:hypothetical protein [Candidatus Babeliales bacterium]